MEKMSPQKRPDCSQADLQEVQCVEHQPHAVPCMIHMPTLQEFSRSISSLQEVCQFLSHMKVDALSPKDLLFSPSGLGLAVHGPKILRFYSWLEGLWKPGVSPVCFWFLFPWAGFFHGSPLSCYPSHDISLPLLLWPHTKTNSTLPWVSQLGSKEVTTCQLVPSYLVTVCSPKGIFGLGLCVCVYMCVFYMLYFYHRKDRQYIMSSVQEVTH